MIFSLNSCGGDDAAVELLTEGTAANGVEQIAILTFNLAPSRKRLLLFKNLTMKRLFSHASIPGNGRHSEGGSCHGRRNPGGNTDRGKTSFLWANNSTEHDGREGKKKFSHMQIYPSTCN